jgi:transcription elongation GreA/GreB family factor
MKQLREKTKVSFASPISRALSQILKKTTDKAVATHLLTNNAFLADLMNQFVEKIADIRALDDVKEKTAVQYGRKLTQIIPEFIFQVSNYLEKTPVESGEMDKYLNILAEMEFSKEEADACYASMTALIEETARASLPTDTREHTTDERLQRRFDSFSRLLCLKPGFSICSSVAIVEGELIIGLSTTGMLSSEEMTFWVLKI